MTDDTNTPEPQIVHPKMVEVKDKDGNIVQVRMFDLTGTDDNPELGKTSYGEMKFG